MVSFLRGASVSVISIIINGLSYLVHFNSYSILQMHRHAHSLKVQSLKPLMAIFNRLYKKGYFPDELKIVQVTQIFKADDVN